LGKKKGIWPVETCATYFPKDSLTEQIDRVLLHYIRFVAFFRENLGMLAPERYTILDFTGARDDELAMASAGPYANHLHLAPDR